MHKLFINITCVILMALVVNISQAEQMSLSTYYPAPYGVYREMDVDYLDLNSDRYSESVALTPDAIEGRIFYDSDEQIVKYFNGTQWLSWGGIWRLSGNNLYTADSTDSDTTWYVGIGTTAPIAALTVTGAIARTGNTLYGANASTHINLASAGGVTGTSGQDYNDCLVLGGTNNTASHNYAIVVGGANNTASGEYTFVGGGSGNLASNSYAVVGGGKDNTASGQYSTVGGGEANTASGDYSTVLGGKNNTASGYCAIVPGGLDNLAQGSHSFAAGRRAKALGTGSFVWADSTDADYSSSGNNTFNIRANGGVWYLAVRKWDIAEEMLVLKEDNIQEAEIVSLAGNDILGKSKKAYDENVVGVVTSDRTTTLHLQTLADPPSDELEKRYVTLAGRVYVKVNNQNGPIKVGDGISSSSTPGVGMKATQPCKIIGYAMEDKDFSQDTQDEVLAFVNLTYYVPTSMFEELEQRIAKLELAVNNQDLVEDLNE